MKKEENYIEINKESWNNRTDVHVKSDFYDMDGFMNGKSSLLNFFKSMKENMDTVVFI